MRATDRGSGRRNPDPEGRLVPDRPRARSDVFMSVIPPLPVPRLRPTAASSPGASRRGVDCWAVVRGLEPAARGLALTSLADSAAHRGVACADRGARQPRARRARCGSARIAGALERLGAGARAARRAACSMPSSASRCACRASSRRSRRSSLLALELRFEQLLIDGPRARRPPRRAAAASTSRGSISAAGSAATDDDAAADWFFRQHEFVIRGGTLRWIDEQRDAPPLALADVDLVVRNGLREHDMRIDATPPPTGAIASARAAASASRCSRAAATGGAGAAAPTRAAARRPARAAPARDAAVRAERRQRRAARAGSSSRRASPRPRPSTSRCARSAAPRRERRAARLRAGRRAASSAARRATARAVALQRFGFVTGDGIRWPQGDLTLTCASGRTRRRPAARSPRSASTSA